jgi:hypothetical protein
VEEVLFVMRTTNLSFPERSPLQIEDIIELLNICLTTTHFQFEDKFHQQKVGMATGN